MLTLKLEPLDNFVGKANEPLVAMVSASPPLLFNTKPVPANPLTVPPTLKLLLPPDEPPPPPPPHPATTTSAKMHIAACKVHALDDDGMLNVFIFFNP